MLQDILQWTAWPMEPPKAYGAFHIIFMLAGFTISFFAAYFLRKTNEKQNKIVLLSVGIFLVLSEVYKQLFYTFVIGEGNYQWWIFPFQLCSVPMYLCLIAALISNNKAKQYLYDFMVSFNLFGGFVAFLEPSGLVHEYWTLTLHAFIWHMSLVFLGLYLGISGRGAKRIADFKNVIVVFVSLCSIAFIINLLLWNISNGDVNMFYVGPATSPIIVFKDIAAKFGWYVNTPIYMACLCLGSFLFFLPFTLIRKQKNKKRSDINKTKGIEKKTVH